MSIATSPATSPARSKRPPPLSSRKRNASQRKMIERLGKLNDRHTTALTAGDRFMLLCLADDYEEIHCPRMASEIRTEAEGL